MNEPIIDICGRQIAPPQSWPEPAPERPRTANVTIHEHGGRVYTIHGVRWVIGTGDGVLICRSMESRQWVSSKECSIEVEAL